MSCSRCAGYAVPAAVLVLLPKCPACLVAWIAIGTGLGITMTAAAFLRTGLVVICLACLAFLAARHGLHAIRARKTE